MLQTISCKFLLHECKRFNHVKYSYLQKEIDFWVFHFIKKTLCSIKFSQFVKDTQKLNYIVKHSRRDSESKLPKKYINLHSSLLDDASNYLIGCVIQKRTPEKMCYFFHFRALCQDCKGFYQVISVLQGCWSLVTL